MKAKSVLDLLPPGEEQHVEFVPDCGDIDLIGQVICGFLNTSGGYVVCGADDQGAVIGVKNPDVTEKLLAQGIQQGLSPGALVAVRAHEIEGKNLFVIEVPAGKDLPYAFENIIYLRAGQITRKAGIETIRDMVLRKQVEPERWERRFSSADMSEDLDLNEIQSTLKTATVSGRFRFRDSESPVAILEDLSVSRYGHLTNGGDVLFGANPALRHPQIRVRAVVFETGKIGDTYRDMQSYEGPLVPVMEDVYSFILRNIPTISRFRPSDLKRHDELAYPPDAIREGLVNAFAHRDYSDFSGGITIHIYPGRLEISNTGKFPDGVTLAKLQKGTLSVLRNPDIAHVLYLRGYMEKIGRGSILIQRACTRRGLPLPRWSEDDYGVTLTFFTTEVATEVTTEVATEVATEVMQIIKVLDGEMSRRGLQEALGLRNSEHFRKAYLQPAIQEGLITMTIPDKPRSSKQQYRLTRRGRIMRGEIHP